MKTLEALYIELDQFSDFYVFVDVKKDLSYEYDEYSYVYIYQKLLIYLFLVLLSLRFLIKSF